MSLIKREKNENDLVLDIETKSFFISERNFEKAWKGAIDIYSNPLRFLVEVTSNAHDSIVEIAEKKYNTQEEIDKFVRGKGVVVSTAFDDEGCYVEIEETEGIGISPERMENTYMQLFETTKGKSKFQIGSKGKGRFSPLAYTNKYYLTTTYEGVKREYLITKNSTLKDEDGNTVKNLGSDVIVGIPKIILLGETPDEGVNKTSVKVYIGDDELYTVNEEILKSLQFFDSVYYNMVRCDLDEINSNKPCHAKTFAIPIEGSQNNNPLTFRLLLNKVVYSYTYPQNTSRYDHLFYIELSCSIMNKWKNNKQGISGGVLSLGGVLSSLIGFISKKCVLKGNLNDFLVTESREELVYKDVPSILNKKGERVYDGYEDELGNLLPGFSIAYIPVKDIVEELILAACLELIEDFVAPQFNADADTLEKFHDLSNNYITVFEEKVCVKDKVDLGDIVGITIRDEPEFLDPHLQREFPTVPEKKGLKNWGLSNDIYRYGDNGKRRIKSSKGLKPTVLDIVTGSERIVIYKGEWSDLDQVKMRYIRDVVFRGGDFWILIPYDTFLISYILGNFQEEIYKPNIVDYDTVVVPEKEKAQILKNITHLSRTKKKKGNCVIRCSSSKFDREEIDIDKLFSLEGYFLPVGNQDEKELVKLINNIEAKSNRPYTKFYYLAETYRNQTNLVHYSEYVKEHMQSHCFTLYWKYNLRGSVWDSSDISLIQQLYPEDRYWTDKITSCAFYAQYGIYSIPQSLREGISKLWEVDDVLVERVIEVCRIVESREIKMINLLTGSERLNNDDLFVRGIAKLLTKQVLNKE